MKKKLDSFLDKQLSSGLFTYMEILNMWFPLILDMFFINAISLLTTSMISSSGQASIAAVSMINPLAGLLVCGFSSIATGGTVIVAQYLGKGDMKDVSRAAGQTIMITFAITTFFSVLFIVFAKEIVLYLYAGAESLVVEKSVIYLRGVTGSMFSYAIYYAIFSVFRGLGETKLCLKLTVYINLAYFLLSFLFINIMHLDVLGTSLAYILARTIGAVAAVYQLFFAKKKLVEVKAKDILFVDGKIIKSMLKISIPFGTEQFVLQGGAVLVSKYMVILGTEYIAANAVANSVLNIIYSASQGVGTLATTIIGRCIGAEKRDLARTYQRKMAWLSTFALGVSMLIFVPLIPLMLPVFKPAPEMVPVIYRVMTIALVPALFTFALSNTTPNSLRAAGDATFASVVSLVVMWAIRVGAGYLVSITLGFGIVGFWVCGALEGFIRACIYGVRAHGKRWLTKTTI